MIDIRPYVVLPKQLSSFERGYLTRVNAVATRFIALQVPVLVAVAAWNHTSPLQALLVSLLVAVGPLAAERALENPRSVSHIVAVAGVSMGGLLVHFGQGPMQIEMHFSFFVLIGMLTIFANPAVILTAAVTTALHHLVVYVLFPTSVFNYQASVWVVAVHALFVVLESIACCFVARSFFDNVIGLEEIVGRRTAEVASRGRDMKLVLDNVGQGFVRLLPDGKPSEERSAILERWLGAVRPGETLADYFERSDPSAGAWLRMGHETVVEDLLPIELALDQMPPRMQVGDVTLALQYRPILEGGKLASVLVIVSDVSEEIRRLRLEQEGADVVAMVERILKDRAGFMEFLIEANGLVKQLEDAATSLVDSRRLLHTLKGNSLLAGMAGFARFCHELESRMEDSGEALSASDRALLVSRWGATTSKVEPLVGDGVRRIELSDAEVTALAAAVLSGRPRVELAQLIEDLRLEPTAKRLERVAEDARSVAERLGKPDVEVTVEASDVRLSHDKWAGLWGSVTHVIRNALDHGIEGVDARKAAGKTPGGRLALGAKLDGEEFVVSFADDGAGIDWSRIRELAKDRGLPSETQADLEAALFSDGLSTKESVSEFSGRGVGMSAVKAAASELHGRIHVHSEAGKGTRVELRFPSSELRASRVGFARTLSGRMQAVIAARSNPPPAHVGLTSVHP